MTCYCLRIIKNKNGLSNLSIASEFNIGIEKPYENNPSVYLIEKDCDLILQVIVEHISTSLGYPYSSTAMCCVCINDFLQVRRVNTQRSSMMPPFALTSKNHAEIEINEKKLNKDQCKNLNIDVFNQIKHQVENQINFWCFNSYEALFYIYTQISKTGTEWEVLKTNNPKMDKKEKNIEKWIKIVNSNIEIFSWVDEKIMRIETFWNINTESTEIESAEIDMLSNKVRCISRFKIFMLTLFFECDRAKRKQFKNIAPTVEYEDSSITCKWKDGRIRVSIEQSSSKVFVDNQLNQDETRSLNDNAEDIVYSPNIYKFKSLIS